MNGAVYFKDGHIKFNDSKSGNELYFYGDIVSSGSDTWNYEDKCPQDIADILNLIPNDAPLDIYINSGGGDVHAGIAIYHQLKRRGGRNTVHIDGIAASIASIIAMAGDEIIMPKSAQLMIHKPWAWCSGNADDLRKTADILDVCQNSMMDIYMTKVVEGIDRETIESMVNAETWLTGLQAAEYFNITAEDVPAAAACASRYFGNYRNTPEFLASQQSEADEIEKLQLELKLKTM